MGAKLSDGFAGAATRQFKGLIHEVESRMSRNDPFKEQFSGNGVFEGSVGQNFSKRQAPFQDYHTNYPSGFNRKDSPQFKMEADGNQEALDFLDELENKIQSPIKNPYDQFPGAYQDHVTKSDNGQLDPRQVDPRQMKKGIKHSMGPEEFDDTVEKKMNKRLASTDTIFGHKLGIDYTVRFINHPNVQAWEGTARVGREQIGTHYCKTANEAKKKIEDAIENEYHNNKPDAQYYGGKRWK